jgi:hypothetical protein
MDLSSLIPVSWRTTLYGIITGVGLLVSQAETLFDSDSKTNPDLAVCVAAVGIILFGVNARDNKVSTEQERAK